MTFDDFDFASEWEIIRPMISPANGMLFGRWLLIVERALPISSRPSLHFFCKPRPNYFHFPQYFSMLIGLGQLRKATAVLGEFAVLH